VNFIVLQCFLTLFLPASLLDMAQPTINNQEPATANNQGKQQLKTYNFRPTNKQQATTNN
jgi:hypothetical protein